MLGHSGFTKLIGQPMSSSYPPAVPFPAWIIDAQLLPARFPMGAGSLNLYHQACMTSTLLTLWYPQSQRFVLLTEI